MTKKFHGLIDGDIILYECIAGKDDEVLADLCYSIKKRLETLVEDCGVETYDIFLSGPMEVNYRYDVYPAYKAKRPPKPEHIEGAKKYMYDKLGAIEGTVGENDDQIGIAAYEAYKDAMTRWSEVGSPEGEQQWYSKTVIMTTDKDLKMIPGWHYSWSPKSDHDWKWITLDEGFEWFFTQMLTGDSTDGIPGLKGVGPKAPSVKELKTMPTNFDRLILVTKTYAAKCAVWDKVEPEKREKLGERPDLDFMLVMADLLWIQRDDRTGREFIKGWVEDEELEGEFPQPEPEPVVDNPSVASAFGKKASGKTVTAFGKKPSKYQIVSVGETDEDVLGVSPEPYKEPVEDLYREVREEVVVDGGSEEALKAGIEGETEPGVKSTTSTSVAEAFGTKSTGKAAAAFAKKGENSRAFKEAKELDEVVDKALAAELEDLKENGIEGEVIPADVGPTKEDTGAKEVEVPVDQKPDVKTYPDGTPFEFDDDLLF